MNKFSFYIIITIILFTNNTAKAQKTTEDDVLNENYIIAQVNEADNIISDKEIKTKVILEQKTSRLFDQIRQAGGIERPVYYFRYSNQNTDTMPLNTFIHKSEQIRNKLLTASQEIHLSEIHKPVLTTLAHIMKEYPTLQTEIKIHTNNSSDSDLCLELSKKKAKLMLDYFINEGISPSRITSEGYGKTHPIHPCQKNIDCTDESYFINSRTAITLKISQ